MTDDKKLSPSKLFKILYMVNIILIVVMLLLAFINGLVDSDENLRGAFLPVIAMLFLITFPLLIPFLILNIWRATKFKPNRLLYLAICIILAPIIIYGINVMLWAESFMSGAP